MSPLVLPLCTLGATTATIGWPHPQDEMKPMTPFVCLVYNGIQRTGQLW